MSRDVGLVLHMKIDAFSCGIGLKKMSSLTLCSCAKVMYQALDEAYKFWLGNAGDIHRVAQFISWVENQSDQYGAESQGFGGFGGLLVSAPMFLAKLTTKRVILGRRAVYS